MSARAPLLQVQGLVASYALRRGAGRLRALDGVDLHVAPGEVLGLVGESGCGKSTLARTVLRLQEPDAGRVLYRPADGGEPLDLLALPPARMRSLRRELQVVFQDPGASLDPRMRVEDQVAEGPAVHGLAQGVELTERVHAVLERVGIGAELARRFPHELSGGQRQRVAIARALALEPRFLVLDEPVAALDVSVQAQLLNLLADLRDELGLAYLFIAHDLSVVRHLAERVAVLYLGRVVEEGSTARVFEHPAHPYTRALLEARPRPDPAAPRGAAAIGGEPPSALDPPRGCAFHPRCPLAEARCRTERPPTVRLAGDHSAACLLVEPPGEDPAGDDTAEDAPANA